MAEELIGNLGYESPQSDTKHQKLLECILTWNSKLYLGKAYTEEQLAKLSEEEVEKLFNNYEAKLSGQMVKSLGHSVINMYLTGVCAVLGISDQDALSEDLESDPFLDSALQRFTCELYYRFGSFLAPLSIGIITSRHYLWGRECPAGTPLLGATYKRRAHLSVMKMENEQLETVKALQVEMTKNLWGAEGPAGTLLRRATLGPAGAHTSC